MEDQIRIEEKGRGFDVTLVQSKKSHVMDHRDNLHEAKEFAFYLANVTKLSVYHEGKKLK